MNHLDFKAAVSEVKAAADYLRGSGAAKVGVVGFCMGGALSFAAAQHAGVDCAAPFYGVADPAICQVRRALSDLGQGPRDPAPCWPRPPLPTLPAPQPPSIKVPVQAHFG
jgi:dienelactone hydrolase